MDTFDLKKYMAKGRIHLSEAVQLKDIMQGDKIKKGVMLNPNIAYKDLTAVDEQKFEAIEIETTPGTEKYPNASYRLTGKRVFDGKEVSYSIDSTDGKMGDAVEDVITNEEAMEKANLKEGTSSTPTGRIQIDSNFDSVKELMEEVLQIVQDAGPSLTYDAITVERKIQELIEMMTPDQRAQDQSARRADDVLDGMLEEEEEEEDDDCNEGKLLKENQYKSFVDEMYQAVGGIDAVLGANKPPNIPRDVWGELYGMAGDMTDKADQLLYLDEGEGDEVRDGVKTAAEKLGMKPNHIK